MAFSDFGLQSKLGLCTIPYMGMAVNCMVSLRYGPDPSLAHTRREMGGWRYRMYPYVAVYSIMGLKYEIKLIQMCHKLANYPMYLPGLAGQHCKPDAASV